MYAQEMDQAGAPAPAPQDKSLTLASPLDVSRATTGLVLQEAVNLGEINPAMARRFGERMDQIFKALMSGAGIQWDQTNGSLKIVWPEIVNPILAAVEEKRRKRELEASTSQAAIDAANEAQHKVMRDGE